MRRCAQDGVIASFLRPSFCNIRISLCQTLSACRQIFCGCSAPGGNNAWRITKKSPCKYLVGTRRDSFSEPVLNERDLIFAQAAGKKTLPKRRGAFICVQTDLLFSAGRSIHPAKEKFYCAVQVFPSVLTQVEPDSFFSSNPLAGAVLPLKSVIVRTSMARPVHCCETGTQCMP